MAARNLISSNFGGGIRADDHRALIQGNLIGTDITGAVSLGNGGAGIDITYGIDNTIGGITAAAGNIISGNSLGIDLGQESMGTLVQGNHIGTDATATIDLGNGVVGILATTTSATIGGTAAGAGNVIAFSSTGNAVGIEYFSSGVPVLHNSIYGNLGEGILFSPGLVPKLTSATRTTIAGTLTGGTPNTMYHLEFFATPDTGKRNDQAQGKTFLGELDMPTDGSGAATFSITPASGVPAGEFLTATATDPGGTTSNFSAAIQIPATAAADVAVTIADAPDPVAPGATITETVTITNSGPDAAQDVTLTIPVPTGTTFVRFATADGSSATEPAVGSSDGTVTATIPTLPADTSELVFTLVVSVNSDAADGTVVSESASITHASSDDPDTSNNSAGATTTVQAEPPPVEPTADLAVSQSASPGIASVGTDNVVFTVTVTNAGPDTASNVILAEALPTGLAFVSATGGGTPTDGRLTFSLGNLGVGSSTTFTIVVRPLSAGTFTTTATVSAIERDASIGNNTAAAAANAVDPTSTLTPTSTSTPTSTPTVGDDGPRIISVKRYGIHAMPTTIVLTFNESLDAASAQNVGNYRISAPGGSRVLVRRAVYDATARTVTLHAIQRISIHKPYSLVIRGAGRDNLRDFAARQLDGKGTGFPGSDFATVLTWRNLVLPTRYRRAKASVSRNNCDVDLLVMKKVVSGGPANTMARQGPCRPFGYNPVELSRFAGAASLVFQCPRRLAAVGVSHPALSGSLLP